MSPRPVRPKLNPTVTLPMVPRPGAESASSSQTSPNSPHLKTLLDLVMDPSYKLFSGPGVEKAIVNVLVVHGSLTEEELKKKLCLEYQYLRNGIHGLVKHRIIKIRKPGDANESHVGMDHIYLDMEGLSKYCKYRLNCVRRKIEKEQKAASLARRWHRKETRFRCTNKFCGQEFHHLYASQVFNSATGDFKCTFCREPVEGYGMDYPVTVSIKEFNQAFGPMYKVLKKIDEYRTPALNDGPSTKAEAEVPIHIRIVNSDNKKDAPTRKEIPPWFLPFANQDYANRG